MSRLQMWEKFLANRYVVNNGQIYNYSDTEFVIKRVLHLWQEFNSCFGGVEKIMCKDCTTCKYKNYPANSNECKNCIDCSNWEEK